ESLRPGRALVRVFALRTPLAWLPHVALPFLAEGVGVAWAFPTAAAPCAVVGIALIVANRPAAAEDLAGWLVLLRIDEVAEIANSSLSLIGQLVVNRSVAALI